MIGRALAASLLAAAVAGAQPAPAVRPASRPAPATRPSSQPAPATRPASRPAPAARLPHAATVAGARPAPATQPAATRSGSLLAAGAAVLPGVLIHGAGHYVLGDRAGAGRLLIVEGVGLGLLVGGVALLWATGGADQLAPFYVVPAVTGATLVIGTWLADLVGSARGTTPWPLPWEPPSRLSVAAGYVGLYGSPFDFQHLLGLRLHWYGDRLAASPAALIHVGGDYWAVGAHVAGRLWRARSDPVTCVSLVVAAAHQRFGADRFYVTGGELYGEVRWNLGRLTPTLRNTYALGRLGWGIEGYGYDVRPAAYDDGRSLLVLELGFGLQASRRVGLELLYRHRRDQLPGGLVVPGFLAGFFGMIELSGRVVVTHRWSVLWGLTGGNGVMPWIGVESAL